MMTRYVLPIIAVFTSIFAVSQMLRAQSKPAPTAPPVEPGRSPYAKQLAGAGIVEPETENISVGSHVPGIVAKVHVRVGQKVKAGASLFQLDDRQLKAELEVRKAIRASAQASLAKFEAMPREDERPTIDAKILEAEVNLKDQKQQYDRYVKIGVGSVSEEELVKRKLAVELADAQLKKVQAEKKLWASGAWEPEKAIARATVLQADSQIAQTEIELQRLNATAPNVRWKRDESGKDLNEEDGAMYEVLQVNVRPGEYVSNTPGQAAVVLGLVGKLHVRVDLDENDISRFHKEMQGICRLRGNPESEFPLTFVRVEPYVIPKRSLTGASTERVDTRVLQVIYAIDTRGKSLYVGQQMDVFLSDK